MTFGDAAREERELQGLSARALASRSGVDRSTIGTIERGRNSPSLTTAEALARGLGLELADLLLHPALFDVEFSASGRIEGAALPGSVSTRAAIWPSLPDAKVRIRARPSALAEVMEISEIGGVPIRDPIVRTVGASRSMAVLVEARTPGAARAEVLRRALAEGSCPRIELARSGRRLWRAMLNGVTDQCSLALQRSLVPPGPVGLFVPVG